MKKLFILLIALFAFAACSSYRITSTNPGAVVLTPVFSSIPLSGFSDTVINTLSNLPVKLFIDTIDDHHVTAHSIYDGRIHRKWFFSKKTWVEKTRYLVAYKNKSDSVFFTLQTTTFEAPDLSWEKWFRVEPSQQTYEQIILKKLK